MRIFAIIVVYNGLKRNWIQKCFDSILSSSVNVDIIAIDNGSTDGSIGYIQEHYPAVELFVSQENLGFGKANNLGIKSALQKGADFVFLLNQDAWVEETTIEELAIQLELHPEYGILSPIHCNGQGDALDGKFAEYISPEKGCSLFSDLLVINRQISRIYDVDFVNAAAWLMNKECLRKVGGFAPMFYHYGEDVNYCQRVNYENLKIGIYPSAKIYHDRIKGAENKYFTQLEREKRSLLIKIYNPKKTLRVFTALLYTFYYMFRSVLNLSLSGVKAHMTNGFNMLIQRKQIIKHQRKLKIPQFYKYLMEESC